MAKLKYIKSGPLHTTIGVLDGVKSIEPEIDPYDMEECYLPPKPNGFKILVSDPIRF